MTARDLTPKEAQEEVKAFMGVGWSIEAWPTDMGEAVVACEQPQVVRLVAHGDTYRAAVDALKAAWREAVRDFGLRVVSECAMTMRSNCGCHHCDECAPGWKGRDIVSRVLGGDK